MPALRRWVGTPGLPAVTGVLVLVTAAVAIGGHTSKLVVSASAALIAIYAVTTVARHWTWLVYGAALVDLLIPEDDRYTIASGSLPVQMEPYRLVVGLLIIGWIISLLVDPRVRFRATRFEGPIIVMVVAVLGSELVNLSRVATVESFVIKSLWLFASFVLFLYLMVSVIRTRKAVDTLLSLIVGAGCVIATGALIQRENGFNIFDHLHGFIPILQFQPGVELTGLLRDGSLRALASAGHPIELSNEMAMLTPIAAYLAISRKKWQWWVAVALLLLGEFASGSKTGVLELAVILGILLWLRPRAIVRCWPALIPLLIGIHFAMPGALGSIEAGFFPKGGLIAQQSQTFVAGNGQVLEATRLSRIGPELSGEYSRHNPILGEGFGTRVSGRSADDNAQVLDDQWLGTLLETGLLGIASWMWLFLLAIKRLAARARAERDRPEGWLPVALAGSIAGFAVSMGTYDAFSFVQAVVLFYILLACASIILWLPPVGVEVDRNDRSQVSPAFGR